MRHGVESQGLLEQLSIELQELARVGRASIRDNEADIQILRMLGEPHDEALFREVHREGAELNTEVSCDIASDLIKQCLSPGHQHEIDRERYVNRILREAFWQAKCIRSLNSLSASWRVADPERSAI